MSSDLPVNTSAIDNAASSGPRLPSPDASRRYRILANVELVMASGLLILAACVGYLTVSFLIWAVRSDTPLFGMFMATSIRAAGALACGTIGLLLLKAARATRGAADRGDSASIKQMQYSLAIAFLVSVTFALLAFLGIVLLLIAFSQSNM